jgi:soluble lytic murein transglycosylase-like protein
MPRVAWIGVVLLVAAAPGHAEIALLSNGMTLKVVAWQTEKAGIRMRTAEGGELSVPASFVRGFVPDEVIEEVQRAADAPLGDFETLLRAAAARHRLDAALLRALVAVESGGKSDAVSNKGARGLMQLMPATAAELGVKDALDPFQNLDGGSRYLAGLVQDFGGDLRRALAAYNAGPGAVRQHGGVPPYRETREYVERVLRRYQGSP